MLLAVSCILWQQRIIFSLIRIKMKRKTKSRKYRCKLMNGSSAKAQWWNNPPSPFMRDRFRSWYLEFDFIIFKYNGQQRLIHIYPRIRSNKWLYSCLLFSPLFSLPSYLFVFHLIISFNMVALYYSCRL